MATGQAADQGATGAPLSGDAATDNATPSATAGAPAYTPATGGASSTAAQTPIPDLPAALNAWSFKNASGTGQPAPGHVHVGAHGPEPIHSGPDLSRLVDLLNIAKAAQSGDTKVQLNPVALGQLETQDSELKKAAQELGTNLTGWQQSPQLRSMMEEAATRAAGAHLKSLGVDVGTATTLEQLDKLNIGSVLKTRLKTEGYSVPNTNTVGTMLRTLADQHQIPATTGHVVSAPTAPPGPSTISAAQMYTNFKSQWNANKDGFQQHALSMLNNANVTDQTLTTSDPGQVFQAFLNTMKGAGNGGDPFGYAAKQASQSASAGRSEDPNYATVQKIGQEIGVNLSSAQLNALTKQYAAMGGSSTDDTTAITAEIAKFYTYDPNEEPPASSYAASALNSIQDTLGSYAVPVTQAQIGSMMDQILGKGDLTSIYSATDAANAAAEQYGKTMAAKMYPGLSDLINQGMNTRDILSPYQSMMGSLLGKGSSDINLEDPKTIANFTDEEGNLLSLNQAQAKIMQNPSSGWTQSADAQEKFSDMSGVLANMFGKVSGIGPTSYQPQATTPT